MSQVLASIKNIKIPYAVEGVIRTAQLDDTIAPEESVQLAVNMNFDRVGALQTRLGVTEYADSLLAEITNFGTLRNSIIPDGYDSIVRLGTEGELAEVVSDFTHARVDDDHIIAFWAGSGNDGFAQVIASSITTGGFTPIGTALEFDTTQGQFNKCIRIDGTHFLNVWRGTSNDAFAQVFLVNPTTYAVTAIGSPFEFDTASGSYFTLAQVDSEHYIVFYDGSTDGTAIVLEVNSGSFAVSAAGSPFTFHSGGVFFNSCVALGDGTRFINFWSDDSTGESFAQVFAVNLGTWAITALSTAFEFSSVGASSAACALGDGEHFINFYQGLAGIGYGQVFNVDLGTYAVTAASSALSLGSQISFTASVSLDDTEHVMAMWIDNSSDVQTQIFNIDPSTFVITAIGNPLEIAQDASEQMLSLVKMNDYTVSAIWPGALGEGEGAMFKLQGDVVNGTFLYASVGDEVYNKTPAGAWTLRRSSLAEVSKPRFAQYLNYIWMVNGNSAIGGDPVATSDGGDFGTDLIPENFPKGDFISAGFEGRVWVADKTLGIIYYTDIVQFVPPNVFSLTFNDQVNFITTIAPQTGEQFTALYEVPRALLVFTENTITRIYGATSLDAYPAYQVGTYSQESIIETKTGIFFHHSSGFYQFDYGSQPVEISRRIIDFVQAIPRSAYEDVKGVYDGFDAVEWSIGQVVVEGVVFSNCVVRYTISTQVWTIYDYPNNVITAMIAYDDQTTINHLMGTQAGKVGAMDTGLTDFGEGFYFEYIDRWRSFTDMYYQVKAISGFNIYSENAAGANLSYQPQKSGANAWKPIGTVSEAGNSLLPNSGTDEFNVMRLRLAGNTKGAQVVVHGLEITELEIRGQETN